MPAAPETQEIKPARASINVTIEGPVLLLMGPLGSFFSRLADFLLANGVRTYKVMFPLKEVFPRKGKIILPYNRPATEFRSYLEEIVTKYGIRHMFMYGDFIIPHKIAIKLAQELGIEAWVFELGYLRPHYVTLERDRVNARSNLNRPVDFYHALAPGRKPLAPTVAISSRWRRIFKPPCFIQHALTNYPIVEGPHKLQPKLSYLFYQLRGMIRRPWYRFTERGIRARIRTFPAVYLVPLQVAIDSQVTMSSSFRDMEHLITHVIESFARHSGENQELVFKHHPRDRGYNNYKSFIRKEGERLQVSDWVHYIHDDLLGNLLNHCKGVITINSTVGLKAIQHNIPTKVLGSTFYDLPGLTSQVPLDAFWKETYKIDRRLFVKFFNHLVESTQVNGNFDGYFPFEETFSFRHPG